MSMRWRVIGGLLVTACLLIDFLPHRGPPHFRYTGSDPATHVWNFGWPLATAIYDQRSGLHVGIMAYVLIPIECAVLFAAGIALRTRRAGPMGRGHAIERE